MIDGEDVTIEQVHRLVRTEESLVCILGEEHLESYLLLTHVPTGITMQAPVFPKKKDAEHQERVIQACVLALNRTVTEGAP
jgi:hypothetical protein